MKKSLLAVLLAVAMVAPAFAAKGDLSINGKVGLGVSNSCKMSGMPGDIIMGIKAKTPISLGAEFFYGTSDNLSVGFGVNYTFNTETTVKMDGEAKVKTGTTNIYLAVKPEAKIESSFFTSIYAIGQIGLAMNRMDVSDVDAKIPSVDSGLYLGAGLGTTIKDCVIVELIFSSSNGSMSMNKQSLDVQYTATTINVGYKFAL